MNSDFFKFMAEQRAVFAFPGGVGTDDMIARARRAGIPVFRDLTGPIR